MTRRALRWLGIAVLVIGYPLLAHYTNETARDGMLGASVAIAPVALIALGLAWRSSRRFLMLCALALSTMALWALWPVIERHFDAIYWLQNVGLQLLLFMTFARTLTAGRQPLCTRFAEAVHAEPLTPQHTAYARQVTFAWTLFFAAMTLASTLLFFLAPLLTWSFFANFLTLPLVALMFLAEYGMRLWLLPDIKHADILGAVRAYWNPAARPL